MSESSKYKKHFVQLEWGAQRLKVVVHDRAVFVELSTIEHNIFYDIATLSLHGKFSPDKVFDILLKGDAITNQHGDRLGLERDRFVLSVERDSYLRQFQALDFRGPFSRETILEAIRANHIDPERSEKLQRIATIRAELEELEREVGDE